MKPAITIDQYLSNMQAVIGRLFAQEGMFHGKEGALKLDRDLGFGLACFPEDEQRRVIGSLYSTMLVRFTLNSGGVQLDNKEFVRAIEATIAESKERDRKLRQQYHEMWPSEYPATNKETHET